jgi:hypothetical protein
MTKPRPARTNERVMIADGVDDDDAYPAWRALAGAELARRGVRPSSVPERVWGMTHAASERRWLRGDGFT